MRNCGFLLRFSQTRSRCQNDAGAFRDTAHIGGALSPNAVSASHRARPKTNFPGALRSSTYSRSVTWATLRAARRASRLSLSFAGR